MPLPPPCRCRLSSPLKEPGLKHPAPSSESYVYKRLSHLGLAHALALKTAAVVKVHSYAAGNVIWAKGGEVLSWQYIVEGLVAAGIPTTNSQSSPISIYGKGSWFGEQPIINRRPQQAV